jgi:hypothetical protein
MPAPHALATRSNTRAASCAIREDVEGSKGWRARCLVRRRAIFETLERCGPPHKAPQSHCEARCGLHSTIERGYSIVTAPTSSATPRRLAQGTTARHSQAKFR